MNIEKYIDQLLYRYQCVTVPGFGAFLTETQSTQWIESTNTFSPPKKLLSFNANIKNNDGLLANHIAVIEKMEYETAVQALEVAVKKWRNTLDTTGSIYLKNIGNLTLNSDKNLVFTPKVQNQYLATSFGLSALATPLVKREVVETKIEVAAVEEVIQLETEEKNSRNYLKYAAIFVVGLGLAGTIGYPLYENEMENQKMVVEKAVQKQVESKIQEATFFIKNPLPAVTLSVKESKMCYHVMAGAFRDQKNAQQVYDRLVKLGYKAKKIQQNKHGLYPVIYASYATFAEAEEAKKEIQNKENQEAWLLIESL